ncbi:hypothetical protein [Sediminibacterium soli]|uniref:hypothetical protein n=1 Tax=Sediminibacterium soli TaxID=2698829 RepID=UPI00137B2ACD|nr:hypothetical protein [Sediminibacterium soli]NCI47905.1 hypothetical protein [Sediminibacterium soli]
MARKKWTAQTEVTDSLLRFREKRKWQLGYRRYVLERMPSEAYAPYFGLDIETLRRWFELQFMDSLSWENFGKAWQFDHIIPATYFDFSDDQDLVLCWSFVNMRVEQIPSDKSRGNSIDLLAARPYFQDLYAKTGYSVCRDMLEKIAAIERSNIESNPGIENFILQNRLLLEDIRSFSHEEFNRMNNGTSAEDIVLEREILKKFGG